MHHEPLLGKFLYDPKYGCPEKIEDWTAEARAAREHQEIDSSDKQEKWNWKCVGRCAMFDYELKEEWLEKDKMMVDVVLENMTKMPFFTPENIAPFRE
jgi:hypothetical protein